MDIHSVRMQLKTKSIYDIPLKVTYYARVSTESDEQLNSLGNQISYYENLIKKNSAWTFVPGYIDEGISGISTQKRENFNQMIEDSQNDIFDFVFLQSADEMDLGASVDLLVMSEQFLHTIFANESNSALTDGEIDFFGGSGFDNSHKICVGISGHIFPYFSDIFTDFRFIFIISHCKSCKISRTCRSCLRVFGTVDFNARKIALHLHKKI